MTQIIPETPPEFDRTRITERPDGFYWQAKDDGREYGPFATLLEAMQSMQADDGAPELNEASRAQLGPDEEKRPYRPRKSDASVEDPLKDWPEESSG
jgi:hypothetical protein